MTDTTITSQVLSGFRRAAAWLLGFAWLGLVFAGLAIAFTPSPYSPAIGWVLLAIAAIILMVTMDRWVGVFSALLTYAIISGIFTLASGHLPNNPQARVGRTEAMIMIMLYVVSAVVSFTFTKRGLKILDRVALFAFVLCFFGQAVVPRLMLLALGIGTGCLAAAWAYDRYQRRPTPDPPSRA